MVPQSWAKFRLRSAGPMLAVAAQGARVFPPVRTIAVHLQLQRYNTVSLFPGKIPCGVPCSPWVVTCRFLGVFVSTFCQNEGIVQLEIRALSCGGRDLPSTARCALVSLPFLPDQIRVVKLSRCGVTEYLTVLRAEDTFVRSRFFMPHVL